MLRNCQPRQELSRQVGLTWRLFLLCSVAGRQSPVQE